MWGTSREGAFVETKRKACGKTLGRKWFGRSEITAPEKVYS